GIYALRSIGRLGAAVRQDLLHEAPHDFGHRAELARVVRQQPGVEGAAAAADAFGEGVAGHVEAAHRVAQEGLLGQGHGAPLSTQCVYSIKRTDEKKPTARVGSKSFVRRTSLGLVASGGGAFTSKWASVVGSSGAT